MNIWNLIVDSNTFNFIVLILIIYFLIRKMNLVSILETLRTNIANKIEMSKTERKKADIQLKEAKNTVANLNNEINQLEESNKKNVEDAVKQTAENADIQAVNILNNAKNVIANEEKKISSKLLHAAQDEAVKIAKDKIIAKLNANPKLHNKYIDEATEDIDKVKTE